MKINKAIISALLMAGTLQASPAWTLEACLKQARAKSLQLESAKLREQQAEISVKQAKSGNRPTVSASIQNTLYDHPFVHDGDHYRLNVGLNASYTLWDGGSTGLSVEQSELSSRATKEATKATERSIQESVLNAFINLLAAKENLKTANASVELANAEFEHYGKLYEAGSITKKDLTQSQANVMQKQVSLLNAQLEVNTASTTLKQLLELPADDSLEISSPEENLDSPDSLEAIPSLAEIKQEATSKNPTLKSDSISVQAAKKGIEVAGKGSSITVTLGASSSTGLQGFESGHYGGQVKDGWQNSVTLGINIPIIDGGTTQNKILQAQVSEAESHVSMQEDAKNLENNIEKLYLNALSADLQWKAALLQVEAETEALAVAEEQRARAYSPTPTT